MQSKLLGGILLIVGTTIGGGMLALPIITAKAGFLGSVLLLVASWLVMTFCAFLILEVNLWLPLQSNIILMARSTLGPIGEFTAWIFYLVLFYCLLAAYIAGGSDILHGVLASLNVNTTVSLDALLFTLLLGFVVYKGMQLTDYVNRGLMFVKLGAFGLLTLFVMPHVDTSRFSAGEFKYLVPAVTVVITSYGFATIIPSLRTYFHNDLVKLRKVILIGSLIPLACYIAWVAVIFGGIPFEGEYGLSSIIGSEHSTLAMTQALIHHSQNSWITLLTRLFTSVCVATSFLGVSLCVVDFLADGFNLKKQGLQNLFIHAATFLPPLFIALLYPAAFIIGLNYAGICIAVLILLLPALMVWQGRYLQKRVASYQVAGGKPALILVMLVAAGVMIQGLFFS